LREQVGSRSDDAERSFLQGQSEYAAGQVDQAVTSYRAAARDPGVRFRAAVAIAAISKQRGDLPDAIEWLERASEVPPPSVEAGHALLYDLADTLVAADEHSRALAVFMELRAAAPDFRDVERRIGDLSARQSGWASGQWRGPA
jgi:tetratricopeptide (TPR) repeat protein